MKNGPLMKARSWNALIAFFAISLLCVISDAYAGIPLETVEKNVSRVLDVLSDPNLKADSAEDARVKKIRDISDDLFDFTALSKMAMGKNWLKLDNEQRAEFEDLFRDILEKAYFDKILAYTDEKVVFAEERMLADTKAEVRTKVITKTKEIPINYRLIDSDKGWRVYDVVIEGISLVRNYRAQFKQIMAKNSPDEMLNILRKKAKE